MRGATSGRDFDPERAGGPVRPQPPDRIRVTHSGVNVVARHVARFGHVPNNAGMVGRPRAVADGLLDPPAWDKNYYGHELREFVRYRRLGWPDGEPGDRDAARVLWNNTHAATPEDYGSNERLEPPHHPECREPELS